MEKIKAFVYAILGFSLGSCLIGYVVYKLFWFTLNVFKVAGVI